MESSLEDKYIASMTSKEKLALKIAYKRLGSSFSIKKSIGFLKWKKNIEK